MNELYLPSPIFRHMMGSPIVDGPSSISCTFSGYSSTSFFDSAFCSSTVRNRSHVGTLSRIGDKSIMVYGKSSSCLMLVSVRFKNVSRIMFCDVWSRRRVAGAQREARVDDEET